MILEQTSELGRGKTILPWYAINVRTRWEHGVSEALARKGYEIFSPMYTIRHQLSEGHKQTHFPLFPGYLFCRLDVQNRLPILVTPGVRNIVGYGKTPASISEEDIASIKTVLKSALPFRPCTSLVPGDRVVIVRGPLMGAHGVLVQSPRAAPRLVVSIDILNRAVSVEIDSAWANRFERVAARAG